jgi:NTP pyrophosphatase (non-canonical NTP hydrolase)
MSGYHIAKIKKGKLGEPSKIQEELDELIDALNQNNKIMALVELSDLYGAIKAIAESLGANMQDLKIMSEATERAFKNGKRK